MIVSYHRNFIYIRTRKTASSTIETFLKQNLGPDDLYVSQGEIRKLRTLRRKPKKTTFETVDVEGPDQIAGHMSAAQIIKVVSHDFWNSCFKFTSERHPYEKAVSLAHFNFSRRNKSEETERVDFSTFLQRVVQAGNYRSFDLYSIDGRVVVDDFIRYERLETDIARICDRLGLTSPGKLPQKKTASRPDKRPAVEVLSEAQKRQVFDRCREEFELLGYAP
jgi:hypothetical protein